jgi:N-acetylmuramoyl-L-alanine amidase
LGYIIPGHGDKNSKNSIFDSGADDGTEYEKNYALLIANAVYSYLQIFGTSTEMTRTDDINVQPSGPIDWRWKIANENGSQILVSFHFNSGDKNEAFAVYQQGKSNEAKSKELGQTIMNNLSSVMNIPANNSVVPVDGRTRYTTLGVLNNFQGSAGVLLELGGIGSASNRNNINKNYMNIGYQIARSIYYAINGRNPSISKESIVPPIQ